MVIEKSSFKVASRFDSEFSPRNSRDTTMSSEDEEFQKRNGGEVESNDEDDDDCDSGAGSDDFDLLELGESKEEFCQIGDQTCSIPFELYDLSGLGDVLSLDVWNELLSEEERFNLVQYLPDMDQETFMRTLKDLLAGTNMHFGSPLDKLFNLLKGGLCEPRVALYRQGLIFFQKRQHYHRLRNHQNAIVSNLCQIRDAWLSCPGYSIEEKLQVLNIKKNEKILMYEKMEELESDGSEREEFSDTLWGKRTKDRNLGQNMGCYSGYRIGSALDSSSLRQMASESTRYKKQNLKGTFKVGGAKGSATKGMELKSGPYDSALPPFRHGKGMGYDSGMAVPMRDMLNGDDEEDGMYEVDVQRDRNYSRAGAVKLGKKHERLRVEESGDVFMGVPVPLKNDLYASGRNNAVNQLSDIKVLTAKPSNARTPYDFGKKDRYADGLPQFCSEDQMNYGKIRIPKMSLKASGMELASGSEPFWPSKAQEDTYFTNPSHKFGNMNVKGKQWKMDQEYPDRKFNDKLFQTDYRGKAFPDKVRAKMQNGGQDGSGTRGRRVFAKTEETESESSENDEDEDNNPLMRSKWAYPSGSTNLMSALDTKKAKFGQKDKYGIPARDGSFHSSRMMSDSNELFHSKRTGSHGLGAEPMGKMHDLGHLNSFSTRNLVRNHFSGLGQFDNNNDNDDEQPIYKLAKNGPLPGDHTERYHMASTREKKHKGKASRDILPANYRQDHKFQEDDSLRARLPAKRNGVSTKLAKKGQMLDTRAFDHEEKSDMHLTGCNSVMKKRKVKADVQYVGELDDTDHLYSDTQQRQDDSSMKRGKMEDERWTSLMGLPISPTTEMIEEDIVDVEIRPQKKPFTLITPTVHTGFSFSVVHLLTAVRMAMITSLPEEAVDTNTGKKEEHGGVAPPSELDGDNSLPSTQAKVPSLSVQEIVNRVRSNPGDPCILETQEPLHDLVRGVLKIFSSKTAPLGAKGWKPLVVYEKPTKSWSWIGPVSPDSSDHEPIEEVTSPEAWGLPHKMLVKLVDSFANWLKNGQETLRQIGSLPDPPLSLMQYNLDEKERFRDLRAQKSLSTISPSSEEVREYFRKEEFLRYSIPDRAFSYTAIDGKKSIVAPLRRCGGKPTSKARDHFMLKKDRPAHVTILCLVRDAAARLPGSTGTRADVCTLIRDSQYIVEEVSDAQVNQVVSGALDRLHYERDPCVQFDNEKKLWVYLHRDREEEDFEDDGTSSTKKWKRQKKEAPEPADQGAVPVAYHGTGEQNGFDLSSDLNVEPSNVDEDRTDLTCEDGKDHVEDNIKSSHVAEQGAMQCGSSLMDWDTLCSTPGEGNKLLCQQNSTDNFDDETCGGEPPA
ncbi:uncharacterized protein LOC132065681 [Lycium ferocissimum]|uniref:uncharacterized protein LOC132065681 n=1 Tax=Lycium ferocissimum TaxID=112874 RepID=UPI0028159311|nr:uncharacterized protein LOC132065681 [Lycium ferocissimum]XP_059315168.1 uncharacterized protein LOC132065681 [Lycium ferocissimum]